MSGHAYIIHLPIYPPFPADQVLVRMTAGNRAALMHKFALVRHTPTSHHADLTEARPWMPCKYRDTMLTTCIEQLATVPSRASSLHVSSGRHSRLPG